LIIVSSFFVSRSNAGLRTGFRKKPPKQPTISNLALSARDTCAEHRDSRLDLLASGPVPKPCAQRPGTSDLDHRRERGTRPNQPGESAPTGWLVWILALDRGFLGAIQAAQRPRSEHLHHQRAPGLRPGSRRDTNYTGTSGDPTEPLGGFRTGI
jgi:hypothetical protein